MTCKHLYVKFLNSRSKLSSFPTPLASKLETILVAILFILEPVAGLRPHRKSFFSWVLIMINNHCNKQLIMPEWKSWIMVNVTYKHVDKYKQCIQLMTVWSVFMFVPEVWGSMPRTNHRLPFMTLKGAMRYEEWGYTICVMALQDLITNETNEHLRNLWVIVTESVNVNSEVTVSMSNKDSMRLVKQLEGEWTIVIVE